jgi:osmoprotectant transport system permease protein
LILAGPLMDWGWLGAHTTTILSLGWQHIELTAIAMVVGLALSFPLAITAYRHRRIYPPVTWVAGLLYTIPSLSLFALLVPYTGFTFTTAEIGLVSYTLLILIRNLVAGLDAVPPDVREAAAGLGYDRRQLLWRVEVPLALPVIMAGIRIATVSTIGLVTITSLIGQGGLGSLILEGFQEFFATPALAGAVGSVALAVAADAGLLRLQRRLAPWAREAATRAGTP